MPDEIKTDDKSTSGTGADQTGTKGTETKTETTSTTFDTSKISDEDFAKVFDDPRTFTHSRFKELTTAQKELKTLRDNEQKEKEKALAEQGKFKELAEAKDVELAKLREQNQTQVANLDILAAASKLGAVDPKVVLKVVDHAGITALEDGTVVGAEDAVKRLLESAPYLKGKGQTGDIGSTTAVAEGEGSKQIRFKHSQLLDPKFYAEHEKEIGEAMNKGLIENDL